MAMMKSAPFVLLAAAIFVPGIVGAQSLPSMWEPGNWTDENGLLMDEPNALFYIAGSGRFAGKLDKERTLDRPPILALLGDKEFREALTRGSVASDGEALGESLGRMIDEYNSRFNEVALNVSRSDSTKDRMAAIVAFKSETSELVRNVQSILTPSQREKCERRYVLAVFYKAGPIEFARQLGATESELTAISSRLREMRDPLRDQLRELETATFLDILDKLEGEGVKDLREIVKSASPERYGVLFTLHNELASFDPPPIGVTKKTSRHKARYRMSVSGLPESSQEIPTDPFLDLLEISGVQNLDSDDKEIAGSFMRFLMTSRNSPDADFRALQDKVSALYRKEADNDVDRFQLYAEIAEAESQLADLIENDVDAATRLLSKDGQRAIEEGRLILYMQRYGCANTLASKFAHERFQLSVNAASWQTLEDASVEMAAALCDHAIDIQREFVKNLYHGTSCENEFKKAWVQTVDGDYMPPLEVLILHANVVGN